MDETSRALGALEQGMSLLQEQVKLLHAKVDALQEFKWRVAGGAAVISVIVSAAGQIALYLLAK